MTLYHIFKVWFQDSLVIAETNLLKARESRYTAPS